MTFTFLVMRASFVAVSCLMLGAATGFFLGKISPAPTPPPAEIASRKPSLPKKVDRTRTFSSTGEVFKSSSQLARWSDLESLISRDPVQALHRALSEFKGVALREAVRSILADWARSDLKGALAQVQTIGKVVGTREAWIIMIEAVGPVDAEAVRQALQKEPTGPMHGQLFALLAPHLGRQDPSGALQWVQQLPAGLPRYQAAAGLMEAFAENQPGFVENLIATFSPEEQKNLLKHFSHQWGAKDFLQALAWAKGRQTPENNDLVKLTIQGLAESIEKGNISGATLVEKSSEWIRLLDGEREGTRLVVTIAHVLAQGDPLRGLNWVDQIPDSSQRGAARQQLLREWAQISPEAALTYGISLKPEERGSMVRDGARAWAYYDADKALAWVESQTDDQIRSAAMVGAIMALADTNPKRAVEKFPLLAPEDLKNFRVDELVRSWARLEPEAAARWVEKLPEGAALESGAHAVARQWGFTDSTATAAWIQKLPPGRTQDAALDAFVDSVDGNDPKMATLAAAAISDPKRREAKMAQGVSRWMEKDRPSAEAWLQQSDLSEKVRLQILAR